MLLPGLSAAEIAGLLVGHAIFGLTVGAIYTRPVGYPADRPPKVRLAAVRASRNGGRRAPNSGFIFATGFECSYPTVEHGKWRRDELHETRHYAFWQRDIELAREIGVTHLRYGPPLHLVFEGPGKFRWDLIDEPMAELELGGPEPIVDLCHFGLPCWLGDFQNPDIAAALAEYARAFAARYPWVRYYTPVNEMYVCAKMSALDGLWNEQRRDEASFFNAVFNLASACAKMTEAIVEVRPDAILINSESGEFYQPCCPDEEIVARAKLENERRFLPLDLLYAHEVSDRMLGTIREQGHEDEIPPVPRAQGAQKVGARRRLLRVEREADRSRRQPARARRAVRLVRDREPILAAIPAHDDAHGNQPDRCVGRAALALAAMAQCPAHQERRRAPDRLHLVQPDRPGGLGYRDSARRREAWTRPDCST